MKKTIIAFCENIQDNLVVTVDTKKNIRVGDKFTDLAVTPHKIYVCQHTEHQQQLANNRNLRFGYFVKILKS